MTARQNAAEAPAACDRCGGPCDPVDAVTDGSVALCGPLYGNGCAAEAADSLPFFVYGTLRPGCGNDWTWRGSAVAAGDGEVTVTGYRLVSPGPFPFAVPADGEVTIGCLIVPLPGHHESVLARLDRLEGYPHLYDRCVVTVQTPHGDVQALMYAPSSPVRHGRPVPGNDWRRWQ